ncbi:MAG TPA: hypothetical protein VK470_12205 [Bacteroidota bacterium]|nr:hypothetical protein [Bacteroidota bacterium]
MTRSFSLSLGILIFSLPLLSQDTTRRALPAIESMLEEAGEDRLGASVFLDEIEYYSLRPSASARPADDPLGMLSASPFMQHALPPSGDSSFSYPETPIQRFSFPLRSGENGSLLDRARINFRSTIENSFTETRGFREHKWDGSPVHSVQRLRVDAQPYSAGFLVEHDEGEQFANGQAVGYISVSDIGVLREAIAGMFTVNAGEGLVFGRSSLISKGTISITQTKKTGATLVPYLSRDEFHYFRGAAASFETGIWSITGFASHHALPATTDESGAVTSFFTSGLFRTENEIKKINAVTEQSAGLIASVAPFSGASMTVTGAAAQYDKSLSASTPYAFGSGVMKSAGVSFTILRLPLSLFGEFAGHGLNSMSTAIGTIYRANRDFAFSVHLRSYSDNYNNPFARSFGEKGYANGERGVYFGFDWNVSRLFGLFSYADVFSITDTKLFTKKGVEYVLRADGLTAKNFSYSAQLKFKTRSVLMPSDDDRSGDLLDDHRQTTLRCMLRYTSPGGYTLTQRCHLTRVSFAISPSKGKGILASSDVAKQFSSAGLGFKAGAVFFDTDSYDTGLSMYEPDVRGAASTAMVFGQGLRLFAMADYAPARSVLIALKYSILTKWNEVTLGSGDDEVMGNTDPELTFQAEISL